MATDKIVLLQSFKEKLYHEVGTIALEEAERNPAFKKELYALLDRSLTVKEDRALFDLPPLTSVPPASRKGKKGK